MRLYDFSGLRAQKQRHVTPFYSGFFQFSSFNVLMIHRLNRDSIRWIHRKKLNMSILLSL